MINSMSNTVKELKTGKMEPSMLVIGEIIWLKETEHFTMLMVMYTLENSIKIEPMVMAYMYTPMVKNMKDFGKTIYKMEVVKKN